MAKVHLQNKVTWIKRVQEEKNASVPLKKHLNLNYLHIWEKKTKNKNKTT